MSECVVRMEMPESCDMCPCLDDYGDYPRCRISGEQRGYNFPVREKRMPNCPIICQLPEGHGRLVDADALVAEFHRLTLGENSLIEKFFADGVYAVIDNAPTIVPAERKDNGETC